MEPENTENNTSLDTEVSPNESEVSEQVGQPEAISGPPIPPPKPKRVIEEGDKLAKGAQPSQMYYKVVGSYRNGVLKLVKDEIEKFGLIETNDDKLAKFFWSRSFYNFLPTLKSWQKVNFLPAMPEICRKDFLNKNMKAMAAKFGREHFDFWPMGYNLPSEWDAFVADFNEHPQPYILKPPLAARGEGIRLMTDLSDVDVNEEFIQKKIPLAQQYVMNPMLFHGHKITFRIYVAITSVDPLRIYVYPNGLARICSQEYSMDMESFKDSLVHLTNWDLQKDHEDAFDQKFSFDKNHDGLRSDVTTMFRLWREECGCDTDKLWSEIKDVIAKTFLSGEAIIQHWVSRKVPKRNLAFEVVGFDILVDQDWKPHLLEVNHTPSLSPHTQLENGIKSAMLHDLFAMVDIAGNEFQNIIEETDTKYQALVQQNSGSHLGFEKNAVTYGSVDMRMLSKMDLWTIVETEREFTRKQNWQRVFPDADSSKYLKILPIENRNKLLILWLAHGMHSASLLQSEEACALDT